ncbi:MAG: class I SAM-dependent methyltransferase [Candidatus Aenigmarchaeota archaeon]|nr:class I SAM-dependent methyltransferase [Candidatus Aenigmarchaeota archaeon]
MGNKHIFERVYENPEAAPWNTTEPPEELVQLIETQTLKPCKTLDIGCGNGNYSIFLAAQGFDVTGIDISENAIKHAKKRSLEHGIKCKFISMNIITDLHGINEKFDFILEWGLLHFILPEFRGEYVKNVANLLNTGGKYISLCFNEKSPEWGGGKYRTGLTGAKLYYSSMEELKKLFSPYFKLLAAKERSIFFKNSNNTHIENYLFMEKGRESPSE